MSQYEPFLWQKNIIPSARITQQGYSLDRKNIFNKLFKLKIVFCVHTNKNMNNKAKPLHTRSNQRTNTRNETKKKRKFGLRSPCLSYELGGWIIMGLFGCRKQQTEGTERPKTKYGKEGKIKGNICNTSGWPQLLKIEETGPSKPNAQV